MVLAKEGDKIKLIRYGQQGVRGAGKNPQTEAEKPDENPSKLAMQKTLQKAK